MFPSSQSFLFEKIMRFVVLVKMKAGSGGFNVLFVGYFLTNAFSIHTWHLNHE